MTDDVQQQFAQGQELNIDRQRLGAIYARALWAPPNHTSSPKRWWPSWSP